MKKKSTKKAKTLEQKFVQEVLDKDNATAQETLAQIIKSKCKARFTKVLNADKDR